MKFDTKGLTDKEKIELIDQFVDEFKLPFITEGVEVEKNPFENIDPSKVKLKNGNRFNDRAKVNPSIKKKP